ncbi:hypothetical protein [Solidesulfovibrio magneticus]|nr:hypothetical protein [Solidesulfovibrio magneticus]
MTTIRSLPLVMPCRSPQTRRLTPAIRAKQPWRLFMRINTGIVIAAMLLCGWPLVAHALNIYFDTSAYRQNVWIVIKGPFTGSYNGTNYNLAANANSAGIALVGDSVPLVVTTANSSAIFVCYDNPSSFPSSGEPYYFTSPLRYQPFELTMTGSDSDNGNLTAINYFTAPLGIASYQNDPIAQPGQTPLQRIGWKAGTGVIASWFSSPAINTSNAVVKVNGQIIRYIGPSSYDPNNASLPNPWPSFLPYTQAIHSASTTFNLNNSVQYNLSNGTNVFHLNLTASAGADGSLSATGSITVSILNSQAAPIVYSNVAVSVPATAPASFNAVIYGGNNIDYTGSPPYPDHALGYATITGVTDFRTYVGNNYSTQSGDPYMPYTQFMDFIFGELATSLLGGFVLSPYGSQPSSDWWTLGKAFSLVQSNPNYYNKYANVVYTLSNNEVYSTSYTDRFGKVSINSVKYGGASVNSWVVGIGAPLPASLATAPQNLLLLDQN